MLSIPILVVSGKGEDAVLLNHPKAPAEFKPSKPLSGGGLEARYGKFPDAAGAANTCIPFQGVPTLEVLADSLDSADVPAESAVELLFHESFHVLQARLGLKGANEALSNRYPSGDAAVSALRVFEARLLFEALNDREPRKETLLAALGARGERAGLLKPELAEYEWQMEENEGLADYTGWSAVLAAGASREYKPALEETQGFARYRNIEDDFKKYLNALKFIGGKNRIPVRSSFYHTGCAYAILLDKAAPAWKVAFLADKKPLHRILAEALGVDEKAQIKALVKAKEKYDFRALAKEEQGFAGDREKELEKLRDSVESNPSGLIIVDVSSLKDLDFQKTWDPSNDVYLAENEVYQGRHLNLSYPSFLELDFSQPVIWKTEDMIFFTAMQDKPTITAEGMNIEPSVDSLLLIGKRVKIAAGAVKLSFEPEAAIELHNKDKVLQIRVWKAKK